MSPPDCGQIRFNSHVVDVNVIGAKALETVVDTVKQVLASVAFTIDVDHT